MMKVLTLFGKSWTNVIRVMRMIVQMLLLRNGKTFHLATMLEQLVISKVSLLPSDHLRGSTLSLKGNPNQLQLSV
jgi:hypothetical protein